MVDKMIREWQFPLSLGRLDANTHLDGVRVIGRESYKGELWMWYFPTKEEAEGFAKRMGKITQSCYYIMDPISMIVPEETKFSVFEFKQKTGEE